MFAAGAFAAVCKGAVLGGQAHRPAALDTALLGGALVLLLAVSAASLAFSQALKPGAPRRAPFCLAGQTPGFQFGFASLSQQLGAAMGAPTECEHGDDASGDTFQATTTGVAVYDWCTNTPSFTRGQDHWILTPQGLQHWTGDADQPSPQPVIRPPDLRHLCLT